MWAGRGKATRTIEAPLPLLIYIPTHKWRELRCLLKRRFQCGLGARVARDPLLYTCCLPPCQQVFFLTIFVGNVERLLYWFSLGGSPTWSSSCSHLQSAKDFFSAEWESIITRRHRGWHSHGTKSSPLSGVYSSLSLSLYSFLRGDCRQPTLSYGYCTRGERSAFLPSLSSRLVDLVRYFYYFLWLEKKWEHVRMAFLRCHQLFI